MNYNKSPLFYYLFLPFLFFLLIQVYILKTPIVSGHDGFITAESYRMAWNNLNFFEITHGLNVINPISRGHPVPFYYSFPLLLNWLTTAVCYFFGLSILNLRICAIILTSFSFLGLYLFAKTLPSKARYVCWLALGIAPFLYYGAMPEEFTTGNGFVLITCSLLLPYYKSRVSVALIAVFSFLAMFASYHNIIIFFFFAIFLITNSFLSQKKIILEKIFAIKIKMLLIGTTLSLTFSILYSICMVKRLSPLHGMYKAFLYRTYTIYHISYLELFTRVFNDLKNYYPNIFFGCILFLLGSLFIKKENRQSLAVILYFAAAAFLPLLILKQMTYFHKFSYILTTLALCLIGELIIDLLKKLQKPILNYVITIFLGLYFIWGGIITFSEIDRRFSQDNINAFLQKLDYNDLVIYPKSIGRSILHSKNPSNMIYFNDKDKKASITALLNEALNQKKAGLIIVILNKKDKINYARLKNYNCEIIIDMRDTLIFVLHQSELTIVRGFLS